MKEVIYAYKMVPIEITKEELKAISKVIEYLWNDERRDYECHGKEETNGHIFEAVATLDNLKQRTQRVFDSFAQIG